MPRRYTSLSVLSALKRDVVGEICVTIHRRAGAESSRCRRPVMRQGRYTLYAREVAIFDMIDAGDG